MYDFTRNIYIYIYIYMYIYKPKFHDTRASFTVDRLRCEIETRFT